MKKSVFITVLLTVFLSFLVVYGQEKGRVLNLFKGDNPYSTKDMELRKYIKQRISELDREGIKQRTKPAKKANPFGEKLKQKAKRITKNEKDFWEAEFGYGIVMVYIPACAFTMGSNDVDAYDNEKPEHKVHLDGYWIGKYEVTFEQYDKYCIDTGKEKPKDEGWGRGNRPVINVSHNEMTAYCRWLNKKTGLNFSLPTEAQWEKAARGTDGRTYPWGNTFDKSKCNSWESGLESTTPVGSYPAGASPYGLMDMAGNVWERCADRYDKNYYEKSPAKNPTGPVHGKFRVVRGGHWIRGAWSLRATMRDEFKPSDRWLATGFRLARDAKGP